MTYAGAFLVVVAVAIFTIYAWGSMPAFAKLAVLGAVTAGFYLGGEFVRTRMELPAAGVALIGVGSAMLLFDGWAVINGFGLQGMWSWAVLLLACSLAYWATELRIAGGWFGAIGAAAQVGWWWLLGQAMHVPGEWQATGIAVVALLWAVGGGRVGVDGPLAALGTVLRSGSVVLGALTVVAVAAAVVVKAQPDLVLVAAALVTGVCATAIVELRVRSAGRWSMLAHIPVYLAVMVCCNAGPSSSVPAVLGLLAVFYGAFAWVRGGRGYALLSTVMATTGVVALAERMEWTSFVTVGLLGALFAVGAIAGHLLEASRTRAEAPALSPERDAAVAWRAAGLVGLGLSTLLGTPIAGQGLPLAAIRVGSDHALLAVWMLALWATIAAMTRARIAGWFVFGWSFYALAAGVAWRSRGCIARGTRPRSSCSRSRGGRPVRSPPAPSASPPTPFGSHASASSSQSPWERSPLRRCSSRRAPIPSRSSSPLRLSRGPATGSASASARHGLSFPRPCSVCSRPSSPGGPLPTSRAVRWPRLLRARRSGLARSRDRGDPMAGGRSSPLAVRSRPRCCRRGRLARPTTWPRRWR